MDDARIELEARERRDSDVEVEPLQSEVDDYESSPAEYEISTYPADFTLEVLWSKWKAEDIIVPQFQRQFVWKHVQASKLIESFLAGLPVPAIFLYVERKSQKYLVIDGQQRLKSIFYFFEGYFGEESRGKRQAFNLKGIGEGSRWQNCTYQDLEEADQLKIKNSVLRAFVIQQIDPADDTSMYHVFERLNTGGTFLTNQEVRNCVYNGSFNELLHSLNQLDSWRQILGKPQMDSRQKDIELILRFIGLSDPDPDWEYRKPMKDFMSRYMSSHKHADDALLSDIRARFEGTCRTVISNLGEKPFHFRTGINSAAMDAVMVTIAKNADNLKVDLKQAYEDLRKDQEFQEGISAQTTNDRSLNSRMNRAAHHLCR